jgi:hypothetical protein
MTGERTELGSNVVLGVGCRENARKHGSARLRLEGTSPRVVRRSTPNQLASG